MIHENIQPDPLLGDPLTGEEDGDGTGPERVGEPADEPQRFIFLGRVAVGGGATHVEEQLVECRRRLDLGKSVPNGPTSRS